MYLENLNYHGFCRLDGSTQASEALIKLKENNVYYGIVENKGKLKGFVTLDCLKKQQAELPVEKICQPFKGTITAGTPLQGLTQKADKQVFLLCDNCGNYQGIVDVPCILESLAEVSQQNQNLIKELEAVLDVTSEELYVTDGRGITLRASKTFEKNSGVPVEDVLGKNVIELEKEGVFRPSVTKQVLNQKKRITTLQKYKNGNEVLVTGIPVSDKYGNIFRVIVKSRQTAELSQLKSQIQELEELKAQYYREFTSLQSEQFSTENIVAQSPSMVKLVNTARHIAGVDSTVLILGETGVGKGVLARFIHEHSPRQKNPFIVINCGAIPENLLESELFGYEPGSFTGAHRHGKLGKIELANNGTLLLDEIGDLPLSLQVKLLHVIDEGSITRIGGSKEIKLNVRFIAATNQDLEAMLKEGRFRKDLFYRLNVLPLEIAPLRERKEDIVFLTKKFLEKYNKRYRKNKSISSVTLSYLQNYEWPGNVRELENLIERLVIVTASDTLEPHHLPEYLRISTFPVQGVDDELYNITPLEKIKNDLEKEILEKLYRQLKSTYKMAELLKINQSTVVRKLKKYNIKREANNK
ncbi:MAG: sigma 54-interacting transcriptional regulator [Firmicutes bacterium]|nr:sigma 54-interacting transcriptional regulator [Bacillota bacterium]